MGLFTLLWNTSWEIVLSYMFVHIGIFPLLCYYVANKHGKDKWKWFSFGVLFSIFGLLALYHQIGKKKFAYFVGILSIAVVVMAIVGNIS